MDNTNSRTTKNRGRSCLQFDLDDNYITEFNNREAAAKYLRETLKITNARGCDIAEACRGHRGRKTAFGFIWKNKDLIKK